MTENKQQYRYVLSAKMAQQLIERGYNVVKIEAGRRKGGLVFAFERSMAFDAAFAELLRK